MEETTIRIRLLFEDEEEEILSPSQKSEGLKRCLLLLKPKRHKTISNLTAHIIRVFQLQHSCPHGLYLYIDGFALPPFESIGLLKSGDMISVRKKTTILSLEQNLEGQKAGTLMLANHEFHEDKETDIYAGKDQPRESEEGGNATSIKRKACDEIQINANDALEGSVLETKKDQTKNEEGEALHLGNTVDFDELPPLRNLPKAGDVIVYRLYELSCIRTAVLSPSRVGKVFWYSRETSTILLLPVPEYPISRGMSVDSSRYKEDGSLEVLFRALFNVRLLNDGSGGSTVSTEQASGLPVDAAAVVVPYGSDDAQRNSSINLLVEMEVGRESSEKKRSQRLAKVKRDCCAPAPEAVDQTKNVEGEEVLHSDNTVDFDKLPPLLNLPKAGDVIVYRLYELSSMLTFVLSPPRVGKVFWCNRETNTVLLKPVPEYPIVHPITVDSSRYKENGSLEIRFGALTDVRLLNDGSGGSTVSMKLAFGLPVGDAAVVVPSGNDDTRRNGSTNLLVKMGAERESSEKKRSWSLAKVKRDWRAPAPELVVMTTMCTFFIVYFIKHFVNWVEEVENAC